MAIDKSLLADSMGRPLTQSLFLEIGYSPFAVYTLKEYDYPYKGKHYPSLKKLYLQEEDPTEYTFAEKHLLGWRHWLKLQGNAQVIKHINEWREELELKIRSQAIRDMMNLCASESGNFSAAKFLANKEWDKRQAGRPSKSDKEREERIAQRVADEFQEDMARLKGV